MNKKTYIAPELETMHTASCLPIAQSNPDIKVDPTQESEADDLDVKNAGDWDIWE